ncbi:alpha/beta fold hydrolase [Halovivax sp.]|uniref:alpha/beta fold hydrolase n=1 Tax=Halovivax sp. TaxID=1935978 RepID=UPI0025B9F77B|nr:alpha/beta hydrolase [Halovivax sp.]
MPRASRDGVSLYYEREEAEAHDAETVVFLQDVGLGRWSWRWQREALRGDYDVIAPDTRGTGRSETGLPPLIPSLPARLRRPAIATLAGYAVDGLAADLEAVLDDAGVREAHLVGIGLGGMVAQEYALSHDRARSLALLATSHGGADAGAIPDDAREELLAAGGGDDRATIRRRMRTEFAERFLHRNPHLLDRIVEWRLEQDAAAPAREAQFAATTGFDASDRVGGIRVPTLVCHGTDDRVVPVANARLLAETIPDARLEPIDGGSHALAVEHADRVGDLLRTFLASPDRTVETGRVAASDPPGGQV